jgi:putative FmdB family regulatory protein
MPIYEYICDSCNHQFEIQQSMNDNALTECPQCSGKIRRVFGLNSVIFKGSGFYCNDLPHVLAAQQHPVPPHKLNISAFSTAWSRSSSISMAW